MFTDAQKPHVGLTLSHLVLRARHTWQALELLFRGYRASEETGRGRFLGASDPCVDSAGVAGFVLLQSVSVISIVFRENTRVTVDT